MHFVQTQEFVMYLQMQLILALWPEVCHASTLRANAMTPRLGQGNCHDSEKAACPLDRPCTTFGGKGDDYDLSTRGLPRGKMVAFLRHPAYRSAGSHVKLEPRLSGLRLFVQSAEPVLAGIE